MRARVDRSRRRAPGDVETVLLVGMTQSSAAPAARSLMRAGTIAAGLDIPRLGVEIALGRMPVLERVEVRPLQFVQLHGELAAIRGAVRGAPTGRSVARIASGIALAAVLPGRMLHPLDLSDPLPTFAVLARAVRRTSPEWGSSLAVAEGSGGAGSG